jgi:NAD(P)H-flavin reductase
MLHWLFAEETRHQGKQLWLLFGNRYECDIYYHDEFLRLADQHWNFHYLPSLSRHDGRWQGLSGYVQQHVQELLKADPICTATSADWTKWSKLIANC